MSEFENIVINTTAKRIEKIANMDIQESGELSSNNALPVAKVVKNYVDEKTVVDQTYDSQSENAQSGKAMAGILSTLDSKIESTSHHLISTQINLAENYYTKTEVDNKTIVDQTYNPNSENAQSGKAVWEGIGSTCAVLETKIDNIGINLIDNYYTKTEIDTLVGDIETLLGGI